MQPAKTPNKENKSTVPGNADAMPRVTHPVQDVVEQIFIWRMSADNNGTRAAGAAFGILTVTKQVYVKSILDKSSTSQQKKKAPSGTATFSFIHNAPFDQISL